MTSEEIAEMSIGYLLQRVGMLPKRYRKPLRKSLEELAALQSKGE